MGIPILVDEPILRQYVSEVLLMNYDHLRIDFLIEVSKKYDFLVYKQKYNNEKVKDRLFNIYRKLP